MSDSDEKTEEMALRLLAVEARLVVIGVSTQISSNGTMCASVQLLDCADLTTLEIPTEVAAAQALGGFFAREHGSGDVYREGVGSELAKGADDRTPVRPRDSAPVIRQA